MYTGFSADAWEVGHIGRSCHVSRHASRRRAATPRDPFVAPTYAGVTSVRNPRFPRRSRLQTHTRFPEREPVPSFVAPRGDVVEPVVEGGGLTPEPIDRQIKAHAAALRVCYMKLLAHDAQCRSRYREAGPGPLHDPRRRQRRGDRGSRQTKPRWIAACVDEFTAMRFPHLDARAVVTYPLIFSGGIL